MKYKQSNKKNLRRISIVVTAQTLWHLNRLCAMNGWGEKDIGRAIDKLVRASCSDITDIEHYKGGGNHGEKNKQ
jgi:hypothetical protein